MDAPGTLDAMLYLQTIGAAQKPRGRESLNNMSDGVTMGTFNADTV